MQLMRDAIKEIKNTEFDVTQVAQGSQVSEAQKPEFSMSYDDNEDEQESNDDEVERWAKDRSKSFDGFPYVRKVYVKTNTSLASQAIVERIFSIGKLVFGLRRANLEDENFAKQLECKVNRKLNPKLFEKRDK